MSVVKDKKSVRNFSNLCQCPRNTQALTTENVRLFKTVYSASKIAKKNYVLMSNELTVP